jgi:hypothetical protein
MELRSSVRLAAALLSALAITACGNRDVGTDPGNAALEVIVNTPGARAGAVAIHGPTVHSSYVTATDTLRGLIPGQYVARADLVATPDSLVSAVLTGVVTGSPVVVEAGQMSSVTATYALRGGSGAMWVGKWGHVNLAEGFTSAQLAAAGTASPADTIGAAADSLTISGTAFDSAGNMWVTDYINQQILKFTPAQMASGASTATVAVLTAKEPWGIAFDANGNLWVAYYNGNFVDEYATTGICGSQASTMPSRTRCRRARSPQRAAERSSRPTVSCRRFLFRDPDSPSTAMATSGKAPRAVTSSAISPPSSATRHTQHRTSHR